VDVEFRGALRGWGAARTTNRLFGSAELVAPIVADAAVTPEEGYAEDLGVLAVGGMPLEDIGVGDARTLQAEAAVAEAEGRFGYGADVGTGIPRKGAPEFVDVRKYAAGSDGDGNGEDGDATEACRSDEHDDWDLSDLRTTSPGLWRVTLETADEALAAPRPNARLLRHADADGRRGPLRATQSRLRTEPRSELPTVGRRARAWARCWEGRPASRSDRPSGTCSGNRRADRSDLPTELLMVMRSDLPSARKRAGVLNWRRCGGVCEGPRQWLLEPSLGRLDLTLTPNLNPSP